jgi:hypothetical protein
MKVTPIDEIRAQAEPDIIEIPGFRPGTTINVAVQPVLRLTPRLLAAGLVNPLIGSIREQAKTGAKAEDLEREAGVAIDEKGADAFLGFLDLIAQEMLVEPTYDQIAAIHPLTLEQELAIANHVLGNLGDLEALASFRQK